MRTDVSGSLLLGCKCLQRVSHLQNVKSMFPSSVIFIASFFLSVDFWNSDHIAIQLACFLWLGFLVLLLIMKKLRIWPRLSSELSSWNPNPSIFNLPHDVSYSSCWFCYLCTSVCCGIAHKVVLKKDVQGWMLIYHLNYH